MKQSEVNLSRANAEASRLFRLFRNKDRIYVNPWGVSVTNRRNHVVNSAPLSEINEVKVVGTLFGQKIVVRKSDGQIIRFNARNPTEARTVASVVKEGMRVLAEADAAAREEERRRIAEVAARREKAHREEEKARREAEAIERRKREAAARREAARLTPIIEQLAQEKDSHYSAQRYARYSDTMAFTLKLKRSLDVINQSRSLLVDHMLGEDIRHDLKDLEKLSTPEFAEKARQNTNASYKRRAAKQTMSTAHRKLGVTLTSEQAEAVATDEDNTLILAGAGSGKTVLITAKIAHLTEDVGVDPERILILAFNRDAAQEIRDRLPKHLKGVAVKTFHAMGRQIIADATGISPSISNLAEDNKVRRRDFIEKTIRGAISDPTRREAVYPFLALYLRNIRRPLDFNSESEYLKYIHEIELRSLNGERVKSREELIIANFLFENGVKYEYERDYEVSTADHFYSQYRPDFYLNDCGIYLEHFALDRHGHAPKGWTGYEQGVEWKRRIHRDNGTVMLETQQGAEEWV